jgi:hypothetical protein
MQPETLLHRQVHPHWFKEGHILSIAFRPNANDEGLLSVYDGDQISPRASWNHYTKTNLSAGVWSVTFEEAVIAKVPARPHPLENFPEHAVIDFSNHNEKQQKSKSKILAAKAEERGCLYCPSPA